MYDETGAARLFTQEEIPDYLPLPIGNFLPKENLLAIIGKATGAQSEKQKPGKGTAGNGKKSWLRRSRSASKEFVGNWNGGVIALILLSYAITSNRATGEQAGMMRWAKHGTQGPGYQKK